MREQPTTPQSVLFPDLFGKPVLAEFDVEHGSSDGGAILLKAADRRLGLIGRMAECIRDDRQPGKIAHEVVELLAQRVFGIACGYPDANDADRLARDPMHKLLVDRDPVGGDPLASQPTLCRFENSLGPRELFRMGVAVADAVIERHRQRLRGRAQRITLDFDTTDDPTHGAQQLSLFNGYYDNWCYLPLLGFVTFNDEADSYAVAAVLRPGNANDKHGFLGVLRRLLERLIEAFPKAELCVRLDAGFSGPELLDFLEDVGAEYAIGIAENRVLARHAQPALRRARRWAKRAQASRRVYTSCRYAARTWPRSRRVVIKAEVVHHPGRELKNNPRFVVTNVRGSAREIYEDHYCPRGDVENRIKELQYGLNIDRTSCTRFWANQLRVLMSLAAYALMQEIRLGAAGTDCARAQVSTLRDQLIKLGVRVVSSVRRIVLHLPAAYPFPTAWRRVAAALGAVP